MTTPKSHHQAMADAEKSIQRNPYPDFKKTEASRPTWRQDAAFTSTQTINPDWKFGDGANNKEDSKDKKHLSIDPYADGRLPQSNYKLLISAIVPRPIGFCSTLSADGKSSNLAPFSYFNMINHDPPLFIFGFAGGFDRPKDSLSNLFSSKECTINIISETYLEAANACSINAPLGVSEWTLSGLTPAPCALVKPARVKEAIFSVEATLVETKEFSSKVNPDKKTGVLAIVEGVRFWVREDAINEAADFVDPAVLRPISRLGRITYGRTTEVVDLPRPDYEQSIQMPGVKELVSSRSDLEDSDVTKSEL